MKKLLLVIAVWIIGVSYTTASDAPTHLPPFNSKIHFFDDSDQDAPVYPNPASDYVFFKLTNVALSEGGDPVIEIRNILGNNMPVRMERTMSDTYRISLSNYPSGYYLLVLQCDRCGSELGHYEEIHKFLKQ